MTLVRNEVAESMYASAWAGWSLTTDRTRKRELEIVMDALQVHIATGPEDPRWIDFIDTLPGYQETWGKAMADIRRQYEELER